MKRPPINFTSFIDLLFILVLIMVSMFKLMAVETKEADIKTKAEFVITVTWPTNNPNDVDTWLKDPAGMLCSFKNKEIGLMHLDRDDLGDKNDRIKMPNGKHVSFPQNQELTTIRGVISGEYVLNIHLYRQRIKIETPVNISITKLNPKAMVVFAKTINLDTDFQEETVTRFTLAQNGDVLMFDSFYSKLINVKLSDRTD